MNLTLLDDIEDLESYIMSLSTKEQHSVLKYLRAVEQYKEENKILFFKPDDWQQKAITLGSTEPYRMVCSANRLGKTYFASYEAVLHATGRYPTGWTGMRYSKPIHCRAMSHDWGQINSPKALMELIMGTPDRRGTGWIPKQDIVSSVLKSRTKKYN